MMASELPLMANLPHADLPTGEPLVLASGSPRRAELLRAAGYQFSVMPASDSAECGMCSRETAPELVARYAFRKAADVASKLSTGLVLAGDTVAGIHGQILGKPVDRDHANEMLTTLAGTEHDVFTGICLWSVRSARCVVDVVRTRLRMQVLSDPDRNAYLETGNWEGKAGAFGYQDGNSWLSVLEGGSESNVVGLPMERLAELLKDFDSLAETVETDGLGPSSVG